MMFTFFRRVKFSMQISVRKQFKVINMVIMNIFVNMVDNFFRIKVSTKMFLHHQTMLKDIALFISTRMSFCHSAYISILSVFYTTFPSWTIFTRKNRLKINSYTFSTACFSDFGISLFAEEFFSTNNTYFSSSWSPRFPVWSRKKLFSFSSTFISTVFSSIFNLRWINRKFFPANFTFYFNHKYIMSYFTRRSSHFINSLLGCT